jgi:hypothetical protein
MAQRVEIVREARERIRRGELGERESADPGFVCCSQELKAKEAMGII